MNKNNQKIKIEGSTVWKWVKRGCARGWIVDEEASQDLLRGYVPSYRQRNY